MIENKHTNTKNRTTRHFIYSREILVETHAPFRWYDCAFDSMGVTPR